jgi:NAD(P)-dependent dehydrogenase (short-subunit alcohol dehydrogenase family)
VIASVKGLESEYGRIDALVNVAGIVVVKPVTDVTWDEFERLIKVNLGGVWLWCKHVIPIMKRQGGGVIVNMASVSGHVGQVDHVLYGATKGAILAFTRALAWELAPFNIRVVSVSPGSVDTEMLRSDIRSESARLGTPFDQLKAEREREQALGRWAWPAEIAEPVFFLASQGGSFITGTDLLVDGGWTAR